MSDLPHQVWERVRLSEDVRALFLYPRLRTPVRLREADDMLLSHHELVGLSRSAAMAPLSPNAVREVLDTAAELSRRQMHIAEIINSLGAPFTDVRSALNELSKLVGP